MTGVIVSIIMFGTFLWAVCAICKECFGKDKNEVAKTEHRQTIKVTFK